MRARVRAGGMVVWPRIPCSVIRQEYGAVLGNGHTDRIELRVRMNRNSAQITDRLSMDRSSTSCLHDLFMPCNVVPAQYSVVPSHAEEKNGTETGFHNEIWGFFG